MEQSAAVRSSSWFRRVLLLVVIGGWCSQSVTSAWAAVDAGPCATNSESRQLDFWLGDWTVTYPGMPGSASSKVSLDLDHCLLVESWDDKSWHGMFADNQGRVHVFEGKVEAGVAEFAGPSRGADGQAVLNRIKVVRLAGNKVEQSWEKSRDNGVTW